MSSPAIVARFVDWNEAQMARGLLEANDIACVIGDGNVAAVDWGVSIALGGIKLSVLNEADLPAAQHLLNDVKTGAMNDALERFDATGAEDHDGAEHCPSCNSTDIFRPRSPFSAIVAVLSATPFLLGTRERHCRACGQEWKAKAD